MSPLEGQNKKKVPTPNELIRFKTKYIVCVCDSVR